MPLPTPLLPLFTPLKLGAFELGHRLVMCTPPRHRARAQGIPTPLMALHHGQRASAGGLVISEPTAVRREGLLDASAPGLYTSEQANLWRQVTDAVHARGGIILAQLAHGAPAGPQPPAAQALDLVIECFRDAAENASDAGFDGVELQAGDGGWVDSLLLGGASADERAGAVSDLVQALAGVWQPERVGLSLAARPSAALPLLLPELQRLGIAYLRLAGPTRPAPATLAALRQACGGALLAAAPAGLEDAAAAVARGEFDAPSLDLAFVANPDLPERLRAAAPLALHDAALLEHGGAHGYTDYPALVERA